MAIRPLRTRLEEIASLEEQNAWLTSSAIEGASPTRERPEFADDPYDDRLRELMGSGEWFFFVTFLRAYIEDAIFRPFDTERRWWNITLGEGGASARINIWRQYAAEVDFRFDESDGAVKAYGSIWIDKQLLGEALRSLQLDPCFRVQETTLKGNTRSQVSLRMEGARLDQVANLFNSRSVLLAVRTLNLDLMRGGVLAFNWSQFHVPKLVSAIFSEDLSEQQLEGSAAGPPDGQGGEPTDAFADAETVYECIVWLRKNRERFVNPVRKYWLDRCAITGIENTSLLEACHIKPFSQSADDERLNCYNGLYLASHVHAAFDANLIGVSPDGTVSLSDNLSASDREKMRLGDGLKIEVDEKHRPFLEYRYAEFQAAQKTPRG